MGTTLDELEAGAIVGAIQEQISGDNYRRIAGRTCAILVEVLLRHDVVRVRK